MIDAVEYRVAQHPGVPERLIPYGLQGRAATVYQLLGPSDGRFALKVFKEKYRDPGLVSLSRRLAAFENWPGLAACRRTVLTPTRHRDLLHRQPDLVYAALMPWILGRTWEELVLARQTAGPAQSLAWAESLLTVLVGLEENRLAHCDLSGPNVLIADPTLADGLAPSTSEKPQIELVDLEQLFGPGFDMPSVKPAGTPGYCHRDQGQGLWEPVADRFSGAILMAEMLGWCDARVREGAAGESYFEQAEIHHESPRYRLLRQVLQDRWGAAIVRLLDRAWTSPSLRDCPTFGDWMAALPHQIEEPFSASLSESILTEPGAPHPAAQVDLALDAAPELAMELMSDEPATEVRPAQQRFSDEAVTPERPLDVEQPLDSRASSRLRFSELFAGGVLALLCLLLVGALGWNTWASQRNTVLTATGAAIARADTVDASAMLTQESQGTATQLAIQSLLIVSQVARSTYLTQEAARTLTQEAVERRQTDIATDALPVMSEAPPTRIPRPPTSSRTVTTVIQIANSSTAPSTPLAPTAISATAIALPPVEVTFETAVCGVRLRLNARYHDGFALDSAPGVAGGGPIVFDQDVLHLTGYVDLQPGDVIFANDRNVWHIVQTNTGYGYANFHDFGLSYGNPGSFPENYEHTFYFISGNPDRCFPPP